MRTNELILYRYMEHEDLLRDMTFLIDNADNDYYNKEDLKSLLFENLNELIELAANYGFEGNLWHTFLTFLLANSENAYSTACEVVGEVEGSVNKAALHDFKIFKELFEYDLKEMWKSPNGTIRAILDGTVFRAPITVKGIEPTVSKWKKPITIARHAYGDVYKGVEMKIPAAGKCELVYTAEDGTEMRETIHNFTGAGIVQGQHNVNASIESFARSCFNYALDQKQDLWFATKDTISKKYDHTFKDIFQEIFDAEYKEKFDAAGIEYFYTLIDDAVARVMKSEGGYIWACKNYDGDVMSDMVSSAFGSLAMMTSVLVSPDGYYEYEAAHGTVQRHYYKHLKGEETSTNSVATIFAWKGALRKRGELDNNQALSDFADKLEKACIATIESGKMTKDLALITSLENVTVLNSENFIKEIRKTLEEML